MAAWPVGVMPPKAPKGSSSKSVTSARSAALKKTPASSNLNNMALSSEQRHSAAASSRPRIPTSPLFYNFRADQGFDSVPHARVGFNLDVRLHKKLRVPGI